MKIDTLVLSGGGPSGIAFFGIFRSLFEKGVLNENLDGIKEIIISREFIVINDISIIIDNQDITSDCILDPNMITYLPSKQFSIGEHHISILFKSEGIKYNQGDFSFVIKEKIKESTFSVIDLKEQYNIKTSFGY